MSTLPSQSEFEQSINNAVADALVLAKLVNDPGDTPNPPNGPGTVTTRTGAVVKNARRILDDLDGAAQGWAEGVEPGGPGTKSAKGHAEDAAASAQAALEKEQSMVRWRGAWVTATEYAPSDLVRHDGTTYVCEVAHTSAGSFTTDLNANRWSVFAAKGAAGAGTGNMLAEENLADLDDSAVALGNLGLTATAAQLNLIAKYLEPVDLNPAAIAIDLNAGGVFDLELDGPATIPNPTNMARGRVITIIIRQGAGADLVSWASYWKFPGDVAPFIDPAAGAETVIEGRVVSDTRILCGSITGFAP